MKFKGIIKILSLCSGLFIANCANALTAENIKILKEYQDKELTNNSESLNFYNFNKLKNNEKEEKIREVAEKFKIETEKRKLSSIVKDIQKQLGINQTGEFDDATAIAFFNYSNEVKKKIIGSYLEDTTKILDDVSKRQVQKFIVVNIPSMTLETYEFKAGESPKLLLTSPVVVGKKKTQTPITTFDIRGIKFNPDWNPTSNMLKKHVFKGDDINTSWLEKHGVLVYDSEGNEISYDDIVPGERYRFKQPSGISNALGVLKFETTSLDDIYLHDTNERHLFNRNIRLYSSGCIRVKQFMDLAKIVKGVDEAYLNKRLDNKETIVEKSEKIPVFITYYLVGIRDSKVMFYPDVYSKYPTTELYR